MATQELTDARTPEQKRLDLERKKRKGLIPLGLLVGSLITIILVSSIPGARSWLKTLFSALFAW